MLASAAAAGEPAGTEFPSRPILRIEAEMHTAEVWRVATDAKGQTMVTASQDKTARVWDLRSGKLLRILRPPIADGKVGNLYAAAISPDGLTAAVGGLTGNNPAGTNSIYLFDVSTGAMQKRIEGLPSTIHRLSYSPDGALLAAALGGTSGIRVFRTRDWQTVLEDKDYRDESYSVAFSAQGRLVATCDDGDLRLYDANLRLIARRAAPGGNKPLTATFSPDGTLIAVGFDGTTAVAVLDASDLSFRYAPTVSGVNNGDLALVAWSSNGDRLYAGGRYRVDELFPLLVWADKGKGRRSSLFSAPGTIQDIESTPLGEIVVGSSGPSWAVIDAAGSTRLQRGPPIIDHRNNEDKFRVASDGMRVRFGFDVLRDGTWVRRVAAFDVHRLGLTVDPPTDRTLAAPQTSGLPINDWEDSATPTLAGKALPLDGNDNSRSLAIASDRRRFLIGADWSLSLFDRDGKTVWKQSPAAPSWDVNLTPDGRFALAAVGDGTIRWYATADGRERLALLPLPDGKSWIAWTPEGFFAAAPGAEALAGYHLNQGADREADFVGLDQLAEQFHRPDLVAGALAPGGPKRIQAALARIGDARMVLAGGMPPAVEIPPDQILRDGDEVMLKIKLTDRGGGVGKKLTFRVNGVALDARSVVPGVPGERSVSMRLPAGTSVVSVTGYAGNGKIESRPAEISVNVAPSQERPTLHVLAIGVTDYRDTDLRLKHASDDARAIAAQLKLHAQGLFGRVNVPEPLVDRQVTYANLTQRFDELATQIRPDDVFVFYAAGHGEVRDGRYLFVPADLVYSNDERLRREAIDEDKLRTLLAKIPAQKSLVLLDTCSAGAFGGETAPAHRGIEQKAAMARMMRATGRAFLGAAGSGEMALEGYNGHGVFTAAVLSGLGPAADTDGNGVVDVDELARFVANEVPRITKEVFHHEQFPMSDVRLKGQAFPIAVPR
jgi:WD40 repeat protein